MKSFYRFNPLSAGFGIIILALCAFVALIFAIRYYILTNSVVVFYIALIVITIVFTVMVVRVLVRKAKSSDNDIESEPEPPQIIV